MVVFGTRLARFINDSLTNLQKDKSKEDIAKFIEDKMLPLVGHYTRKSEAFYRDHKFLCLAFFTVDWSFDHREGRSLFTMYIPDATKFLTVQIVAT